MKKSRCQHSMVAVGNSLFCLGGSNTQTRVKVKFKQDSTPQVNSSVEEYNIAAQRWFLAGDLLHPVCSAASAVCGEQILVFGGSGKDFQAMNYVQCFHSRLKQSSVISNLPYVSRRLIATTIGETVYITSKEQDGSSILKLTSDFGFEDAGFEIPTDQGVLGISHHDRQFVILIESAETHGVLSSMIKVNLRSSKSEVIQMNGNSAPKVYHASHRCYMDKKFLYHTYFH